ncbi:outer dense fiber protein 2 [Olea europaea var. sylvestris]|uniref:outer dense fiber protein 2 n=1 Tax=Olea europaea var. sylvestris TaxID=158386 RepID=UPI000C1CEDE8|nr:outer dense fiber protein 2 [Olea europaea var. sylvestris]XP_022869878.1 outer dense fiber protein 2 [Olea europaea var. sylvestris]
MKKLFSFRSNASNGKNNNQVSPPSTDKQVYWERPRESINNPRKEKHGSENQVFGTAPCLRRSLSYSSGALHYGNFADPSGSPRSTSNSHKQSGQHSTRCRTPTPERQSWKKKFEVGKVRNEQRVGKSGSVASREHSDISEASSYGSSNVSNKVLDRYIDGEQQMDTSASMTHFSTRNHIDNGNSGRMRPPRVQCTAPISPSDGRKQKPKSQSFREAKVSRLQLSSGDWEENGFCRESPRKLAKNVVERLTQSRLLSNIRSKEYDSETPITIEDIYSRTFNESPSAYSDEVSTKNCTLDGHPETTGGYHHEETLGLSERETSFGGKDGSALNVEAIDDTDIELFRKFKEAEDRAAYLSEELEQENFFQVRGCNVPVLIQTIRSLTEEKVKMAFEVSAVLQDRIAEKALFREELKLASEEASTQTRRLEKEKHELQLALEKELDRRSIEWSHKLEKYQSEEHRLRERVRELAEQNVSLQMEVSSFSEREMDTRTRITNSEKQLESITTQVNEAREEKQYLQKNLIELQDKFRAAEEDRDCFRSNYEAKTVECKDMHRSISRLQRTCRDQEKTIDGLRGLCEDLRKKVSLENCDFEFAKLQVEHMRLTGVEHALRKEVESYRLEVDSLRRENIDLLNRLKNGGKDGATLTFKLDRELQNRISCLLNQVLPSFKESSQLSRKLLEYIKANTGRTLKSGHGSETGLDCQFILECEVKLQGFERANENLTRSVQTISSVLYAKSTKLHDTLGSVTMETQSSTLDDESYKLDDRKSEEIIRSELKAETLLTSLLREKLYSKELDMEQLQAELAAAVRGNDILKCEVQNALDNFSCVNHKMKDLEIQMMKKDDIINQLQTDLQECKKELTIAGGILPKVSEERDLMWEEIKQYSEKNMLLNSEINMLKKKIETLDEDILMKEGQITILKDTIGKPFDLLASPDSTRDFLLA